MHIYVYVYICNKNIVYKCKSTWRESMKYQERDTKQVNWSTNLSFQFIGDRNTGYFKSGKFNEKKSCKTLKLPFAISYVI